MRPLMNLQVLENFLLGEDIANIEHFQESKRYIDHKGIPLHFSGFSGNKEDGRTSHNSKLGRNTLHFMISLSLVKQKSHLGCCYLFLALSTS